MSSTQPFTHTKALLSYLFSTYSSASSSSSTNTVHNLKPSSGSAASSPPAAAPLALSLTTSQLELSVRKLALAQSRAHSQAASSNSTSSASASGASATDDDDDDGDDDEMRRSELTTTGTTTTMTTTTNTSSNADTEELADEDKIKNVLSLLADDSIDDDDKPEELKELLRSLIIVLPDSEPPNLDPIILSLLHRYREDLHPSSNPLPPLPNHGSTTPSSRPSVSRSSSFRRTFPSGALGLSSTRAPPGPAATSAALSSSVSSTSSRSAPTSPFRSASPSLGHSARHTPAHSPWSSPRPTPLSLALSANAAEFKFSAGASEFKPGGVASPGGIGGVSSSLLPGTPGRAQQAQANWAFTNSPLGTPKYGNAPSNGGGSNVTSPNYFPRALPHEQSHIVKTGRLPWQDDDGDDDENPEEPKSYEAGGAAPLGYAGGPMYEHHLGDGQRRFDGGRPTPWEQQQQQWGGAYQGRPAHGGWDFIDGEGFADTSSAPHTPTFEDTGMTISGPAPGEMPSIEFANVLVGSAGLGGMGAYRMTPFDHLHSIFASSNISPEVLEDALAQSGFDVDKAIELIIEQAPMDAQGGGAGPPASAFEGGVLPPSGVAPVPAPRATASGSGSRPMVMSRDSFDAFMSGGRGGPTAAPTRWPGASGGSGPGTPPDGGRGVGGRVCRYYLAGNCLRSDCKFSHDVGKAVCKFWLRGHCLKGDGRCDFLHSIPPIMRADFEARARRREQGGFEDPDLHARDEEPDLDFPTLGEMSRNRRGVPGVVSGRATVVLDPARTRFSGAVKFGPKFAPTPIGQTAPRPTALTSPMPSRDTMPRPKPSARVPLRPPALLPTLPTGPQLAALYVRYRSSFLELGAKRNKCLARAAECYKKGDGAGARRCSREAQDWSRQVSIEGRDSASRIVAERKRLLKEAVVNGGYRGGSTEDAPDRKIRGQEMGGAICLGVVSQQSVPRSNSGGEVRHLTTEERTEVALDLHALHTDEAISFMGDCLLALERERFQGLVFFVIGQQKHSGSSAPDRAEAAGRLRLEQACSEFLSDQGWPWQSFSGVLAVDALR